MTILIIFLAILIVINYFENKKRWKKQEESFNSFLRDLDEIVDNKLDEAIKKAEEIAEQNGVDLK